MEQTITMVGTCPGGEHIILDVVKDGVKKRISIEKSDIINAQDGDYKISNEKEAIARELHRYVKESGVKNATELKTNLKDITIEL